MGIYFLDTSALVKSAALGLQAPTFVSADTELLNTANAEGLSVENPGT
jgi:hypothetical protein